MSHLEREWVSLTGVNDEPGFNSSNWDISKFKRVESKPLVTVNGNAFTLDKHPNNSVLANSEIIELNDMIVNGWWDNSEYWGRARFTGSNINTKTDWQILDVTKQIPIL